MTVKAEIEIDEKQLKSLVYAYLVDEFGLRSLDETQIHIEVKSKQNYRSEWEEASFRAKVKIHK